MENKTKEYLIEQDVKKQILLKDKLNGIKKITEEVMPLMISGNCMVSSAIIVSLLNDDNFFVQEGKASVKGEEEKLPHTWVIDTKNNQIIDFAKIQFIRRADIFLKIAKENKNFKNDYEMIEDNHLSVAEKSKLLLLLDEKYHIEYEYKVYPRNKKYSSEEYQKLNFFPSDFNHFNFNSEYSAKILSLFNIKMSGYAYEKEMEKFLIDNEFEKADNVYTNKTLRKQFLEEFNNKFNEEETLKVSKNLSNSFKKY